MRKPIRTLADASQRLAAGDFEMPLPKSDNDEVGTLIDSFARMRDAIRTHAEELLEGNEQLRCEITERKRADEELREHRDMLEKRVEERTAELFALNKKLAQDITDRKKAEAALRQSEERYRTVADFTYDWEFWVGPNGEFLWVSPSCERVTGYPADDFIEDRMLFQRIIHPDDREFMIKHIDEPLDAEQQAPHSLDFRIVRRDGRIRWINHVCQPVVGEEGKLLGKRSSNRDVTARIDAQASLKASEDRFRHIYENAPVMMHSIDETGIIRNVNKKWLEVLGYSKEEVLGRTISFVMTPESASRAVSTILPQYWRDGSVRDVPYQYITKDGTVIDVLLDSVVMEDPVWGKTSLSVVRNITLRKRAEEETRRTKALLNSIIQNLPTSVFLKDAEELKYVLWNRASEELYGYSREEVMGKTAHDFFPRGTSEPVQRTGPGSIGIRQAVVRAGADCRYQRQGHENTTYQEAADTGRGRKTSISPWHFRGYNRTARRLNRL